MTYSIQSQVLSNPALITTSPRLTVGSPPKVGWGGIYSEGVLMSRRERIECVLITAVPVGYFVGRLVVKTVWGC